MSAWRLNIGSSEIAAPRRPGCNSRCCGKKWPLAVPVERQDVGPLAIGVAREIGAAMGWSLPYTLGALHR